MSQLPILIVTLAATVGAVGCKKKEPPQASGSATIAVAGSASASSGGSGSANGSASAKAKFDPWAHVPEQASKIGASAGDELAKIGPSAASKLNSKIDTASIAKPARDKVQIRGLTASKQTGFRVSYNPSTIAAHEQFREALQSNHVFEEVAEGLNKTIRVPVAIDIQLVDCQDINAFYDPNGKRIIMCYELLSYYLEIFKGKMKSEQELGQAVIGATMFAFFHESGHALIDVLDLPAVGREEDSADQLATLTLIAAGDDGVAMALSGAYWFQLQHSADSEKSFWDEHSFDGQRFYNIMCMIYGSNPTKYKNFIKSGDLPAERAERCEQEYSRISNAWKKLLKDHLTDEAANNMDTITVAHATNAGSAGPNAPGTADDDTPTPTAQSKDSDPWADTKDDSRDKLHKISCDTLADKVGDLIEAEVKAQTAGMSEEQIEAANAKAEAEIPAVLEQVEQECETKDWPDAARTCLMKATGLDSADKCGV